ncbi:unnamed protein product [Phytophthora fragariaefolia]|uniref:Unnamed protein product n=1 Tax=Phytophthora fragariaefolia TaxID=1490495 RepID=A0A9W6XKM2_9STRA|nr:unnamed protein product [Phytophthora fragariaefolia]
MMEALSLPCYQHVERQVPPTVIIHKDHDMTIQERQHRIRRSDQYMINVDSKTENKHPSSSTPDTHAHESTKRQKTCWKSLVTQYQIFGCLVHNIKTTPAVREFHIGVKGDPNVTIPPSATYQDIVDNHYEKFTEDTAAMQSEEFKELDETPSTKHVRMVINWSNEPNWSSMHRAWGTNCTKKGR